MNLTLFKAITGIILFVVAVIGAFLPLKVAQVSDSLMKVCNAFAGGILIAASICHMLADANGDLEDAGMAVNKFLNGGEADEPFPLGYALFILGFFLPILIEVVLDPHAGQPGHAAHGGTTDTEMAKEGSPEASLTGQSMVSNVAKNATVASYATLIALVIHSSIEGIAAGATSDPDDAFAIVLAIICHKGFAAFALGSTTLPLRSQGKAFLWAASLLIFCAATPLAMIIGAALQSNLEGTAVASVTCAAAGSLLAIGVNEMLVPSLSNAKHPMANCLVALAAAVAMSLLAAWA